MHYAYMIFLTSRDEGYVPVRNALKEELYRGELFRPVGSRGRVYRFETLNPLNEKIKARFKHGNPGMAGFTEVNTSVFAAGNSFEWDRIDV